MGRSELCRASLNAVPDKKGRESGGVVKGNGRRSCQVLLLKK